MGRMLREAQKQERTARGAKPSFILLESIRCQIDMAAGPLACRSAAAFTRLPPAPGLFLQSSQKLLIVTRPPSTASHPGWSRSRPGSKPASSRLLFLSFALALSVFAGLRSREATYP